MYDPIPPWELSDLAWEQSDLGPYCLQYTEYRLPKNISSLKSRQQVMTGGLRVNITSHD